MKRATLWIATAASFAAACARDARPPAAVSSAETRANQTSSQADAAATDDVEAQSELTAFVDPGASLRRPVRQGVVVLHAPDGQRLGTVQLVDAGKDGIDVIASVERLPPGKHAFHVHVYGDCSARDLKSAGPHFHFTGSSLAPEENIITGDLGELLADDEGRATHRARLPFARLHGEFSLLGRSVVVHEKGNDPNATPDGGAGARLACGVIGIADADELDNVPTARR